MSTHQVQDYKDHEGNWRWRIIALGTKGSAVEDNIVADSSQGYANRVDMLKSFFGIFFGEYDDSFLALYNTWNPQPSQVEYQPPPANDAPVTDAVEDSHTPSADLGA